MFSGLIFSRQLALNHIAPKKNSENFGIFQSRNILATRHLQKPLNVVLTKTAEIGKASAVAPLGRDKS